MKTELSSTDKAMASLARSLRTREEELSSVQANTQALTAELSARDKAMASLARSLRSRDEEIFRLKEELGGLSGRADRERDQERGEVRTYLEQSETEKEVRDVYF
jgi:uncharacterized protein (DUF3084 family)